MSGLIDHQTYYVLAEAYGGAGTNRNILLLWIPRGRFVDVKIRDRNGWVLFREDDIERLEIEVNRIEQTEQK